MKKVDEPENVEETWECPRCLMNHCGDCVTKHEVDFEIKDCKEGYGQKPIEWKGLSVCPWCYNQLFGLKQKVAGK